MHLLHLHLALYDTPWVKRALQADRLRSTAQVETLDLQDAFRTAYDLDGRGILLGGLPGCGKSTLVTSFLGTPGAELLADNIVLHDLGVPVSVDGKDAWTTTGVSTNLIEASWLALVN